VRSLLAAEVLKLRTTRTTWVLLLVGALLAGVTAAALVGSGSLEDDRALALAQGASFAAFLALVLGALLVTSEYRHGTITTTFLGEPRRGRVLAAKLVVAAASGVLYAGVALAVTAAVALPWLAARGEALALDGQALEVCGRLALALALYAVLGAAVGAMIQGQVGTIVGILLWFLVVESLVGLLSQLLLGSFGEPDPLTPYLPGSALGGIVGGQGSEFMLRGPYAALLALAYVAGLAALGWLSMTRRDP
jgi:ABC-2 type transport system permease protein